MLGVMRAAVLLQIERSEAIPLVETTFQNSSVRKIYISMKFWKSSLPLSSDLDQFIMMLMMHWKWPRRKLGSTYWISPQMGIIIRKNEDIYLDAFKGVVMQLQSWKD